MRLFAVSAAARWSELHEGQRPRFSSYVDDIYCGIPHCDSFEDSLALREFLCEKGEALSFVFNRKPKKTPLPSKQQVILGCLYDSTTRYMKSSIEKVEKYMARIDKTLRAQTLSVQEILSLHGNLMFAANVTPFGLTFLAALSNLTAGRKKWEVVELTELTRLSLSVYASGNVCLRPTMGCRLISSWATSKGQSTIFLLTHQLPGVLEGAVARCIS